MSKRRLGSRARLVDWIVGDATTLEDVGQFDVWHDRAVFHFLTADDDRRHYVRLAERTIQPGGTAIMATFASDGPEQCSGLEVRRYGPEQLAQQCGRGFELTQSERHVHITPRTCNRTSFIRPSAAHPTRSVLELTEQFPKVTQTFLGIPTDPSNPAAPVLRQPLPS